MALPPQRKPPITSNPSQTGYSQMVYRANAGQPVTGYSQMAATNSQMMQPVARGPTVMRTASQPAVLRTASQPTVMRTAQPAVMRSVTTQPQVMRTASTQPVPAVQQHMMYAQPMHPQPVPQMMHPQQAAQPQTGAPTVPPAAMPQRPQQRPQCRVNSSVPQGWIRAKCIKVISGDTIEVVHPDREQQGQFVNKQLIIDMILAPKTARTQLNDEDAFGWQAREFLRKTVVSTPPRYVAFHDPKPLTTASNKPENLKGLPARYFANVILLDPSGNPALNVDLAQLMVSEGFASLKELRRDRFGKEQQNETLTEENIMQAETATLHPLDQKFKRLRECEMKAIQEKKGKHSVDPADFEGMCAATRDVEWIQNRREHAQRAKDFYEIAKGRPLDAIVNFVREGTVIQLEVLPDDKFPDRKHRVLFVNILGIKSPAIPLPYKRAIANWKGRSAGDSRMMPTEASQAPEKFSDLAKKHTEDRLLHQRVNANFKFCDDRGNLYAEITLNVNGVARNIAPSLLKKGYAVVIGWQATRAECKGKVLFPHQNHAIKMKTGIWEVPPAQRPLVFKSLKGVFKTTKPGIRGTVIAVRNADAIEIKMADGKIRIYYLASIRSFHEGYGPNDQTQRQSKGRDFDTLYKTINQSKEYLRVNAIGKVVEVEEEYSRDLPARTPAETGNTRHYATIFTLNRQGQKDRNLAKELVTQGFAEALSYDPSNLQRSNYWHEFIEENKKAVEQQKGYYDPKFKEDQFLDLSVTRGQNMQVCKNQLRAMWDLYGPDSQGKRLTKGLLPATVEFVFGGHKIKVIIDMQNLGESNPRGGCRKRAIALFLEGIECTRARMGVPDDKRSDLDELNEAVSDKAKRFVEEKINQQKVHIKITAKDTKYNYLGSVFVGGKKENVAHMLVSKGLAKCRSNQRRNANSEKLQELEKIAREAKLGYWEFTEKKVDRQAREEMEAKAEEAVSKIREEQEYFITHIHDGATFFARPVPSPGHDRIEKALAGYPAAAPKKRAPFNAENREFKRKDVVAGKYMGGYYRCRIERVVKQATGTPAFEVNFIDYGNVAKIKYTDMEHLPDELKANKVYPLCNRLRLALLMTPPREVMGDTYMEAGQLLNDLILEKKFKIKAVRTNMREDDGKGVDLLDGDESINCRMVREGLLRLNDKVKALARKKRLEKGPTAYVQQIEKREIEARQRHRGMFRHGDVDGESDSD